MLPQQPQVIMLPETNVCPVCMGQNLMTNFLRHGKVCLVVFTCDCGTVLVLPKAPAAYHVTANDPDLKVGVPGLLLSGEPPIVAVPPGYKRPMPFGDGQ